MKGIGRLINFFEIISIVLQGVLFLGCIFLLSYLAYVSITAIIGTIKEWNWPYVDNKKYHIILYPSVLQKFGKLLLIIGLFLFVCFLCCLTFLFIIFFFK